MIKKGEKYSEYVINGEKVSVVLHQVDNSVKTAFGVYKFSYNEFIEQFIGK